MTQNGHVVAPAATATATATATSAVARPLPDICFTLRRKVLAFLDQQQFFADDDGILRRAQTQTRASIEVVEEALRRYGYAFSFFFSFF